jgi:hypothetical protein
MRESEAFRRLGFVRLGDYAVERLGISHRTAQELMRMERALLTLPLTASAYERREISSGHIRVLTRVASPVDEAMWVTRARRMGLRRLGRLAAAAVQRRNEFAGESVASAAVVPSSRSHADKSEPGLPPLEIEAPAWIASMWRETKVLIRRLSGSLLPAGACLDSLLAEAAGGGWSTGAPGGEILHESACVGPARESSGTCRERWSPPHVAPGAEGASLAACGPPDKRSNAKEDEPLPDARDLDRELRLLVTARQREEARLADELAACRRWEGFRSAGYESLEAYALDRCGLSTRRVYYLLALHQSLVRLPALRRALLAGRLTLRQTLLVAKGAAPATAQAWIRRAEAVTLRRLEDEIEFWLHLRDVRNEVWRLLRGRPLPEGTTRKRGGRRGSTRRWRGTAGDAPCRDADPWEAESCTSTMSCSGTDQ